MKQLLQHGRIIRLAAGVLAVLTIVTTPLAVTQAKYTANGTVTASARVAKWDIKFTQDPATGGTGYFSGAVVGPANPNANAGYPAQTTARTFKIKNGSEVTADVALKLYYVQNDSVDFAVDPATKAVTSDNLDYPAVLDSSIGSGSSGIAGIGVAGAGVTTQTANSVYRFEPGAEGTFTITFRATSGAPAVTSNSAANVSNCIRKYKVFFDAVQVN